MTWEIQIIAIHINIAVDMYMCLYSIAGLPTSQALQSHTKRPHSMQATL